MRDYYRILGIRPDATQDEIKEAWIFSVKAFHPDKFAGSSPRQNTTAEQRTKAINEAYELLSDPIRRAGYDREYAREPRTNSAAQPPPQPPPPPPPSKTASSADTQRPSPVSQPLHRITPFASWSLLLAGVSFLFGWLFTAIPAIICGHIARSKIRKSGGGLGGKGIATAGLTFGYIALVLGVMAIPLLVGMIGRVQSERERLRLGAERQQIVSDDGKIKITVPASWTKLPDLNKNATVKLKHAVAVCVGDDSSETYLIVITHAKTELSKRLGSTITLEEQHQLTRDQRLEEMKNTSATSPISLLIDGHPALQDEISGTRKGVDYAFLHITVNEGDCFQEILAWAVKSRWQEQNELLREIASSFRTEK
jgi:hypothetical protein